MRSPHSYPWLLSWLFSWLQYPPSTDSNIVCRAIRRQRTLGPTMGSTGWLCFGTCGKGFVRKLICKLQIYLRCDYQRQMLHEQGPAGTIFLDSATERERVSGSDTNSHTHTAGEKGEFFISPRRIRPVKGEPGDRQLPTQTCCTSAIPNGARQFCGL